MQHYSKFFNKFIYQDKKQMPPDDINLFVGSSTFKHWKTLAEDMAPKPVLNRGFGGSTMAQLLQFHERLILPYKYKKIFIYEGDNDIGRNSPKIPLVLKQLAEIVEISRKHQPEADVYVLSLKCSPSKPGACATLAIANEKLKEFCDRQEYTHFIDFASDFFDENGVLKKEFFKDSMHPSQAGYRHITKVLKPYLYPSELDR